MRLLVACTLAVAAACSPSGKPPGGNDAGPGAPERVTSLDFQHPGWLQDRYAIMARWYEYESTGHTIAPRPFAWVLAEGAGDATRYAALRVVSYYDEDTAEAGRITLAIAPWNGAAYDAEQPFTTSINIKETDEPVCVDVFARAEQPCTGDAWHLMLRMYKDMAPLSVIVIKDPGLFVRSWAGRPDLGDVRVARVDDVDDFSSLPAPTSFAALADGPTDWVKTDWDFGAYAPNLPEKGMALGARVFGDGFTAREEAYVLLTGRFLVVKATIRPVTDGVVDDGIAIRFAADELEREDMSVRAAPALKDVVVPAPAVGDVTYATFTTEDLAVDPADLAGTSWPFLPPDNARWDLAFERVGDDDVRVLLSPAAAVFPVRPHLCDPDGEMPPLEDLVPPHYVEDEAAAEPCPEE